MAEPLASFNFPQWDGIPREAGEVWRLTKGGHTALRSLFTHPCGGEIRVTIDGELWRSEAGRDGLKLVDLALAWRDQFRAKGWQ